jgi:hypothetical protein
MITANELKIRGIKAIEDQLKDQPEVAITVRGRVKYVAMTVEQYEIMREAELFSAYQHSLEDIKAGRYTTESGEEHIERLWKEI